MNAIEASILTPNTTTSGELSAITSESPVLSSPGKRKRSPSHDDGSNQDQSSSAELQAQDKEQLNEMLRNLVNVLNESDSDLHLLTCPLPSSKPRSKRAKLSEEKEEIVTIQSKVAMARYNTLPELLSDVDKASASVIERQQTETSLRNGVQVQGNPLTELVNRIAAFKKLLNTLLRQTSYLTQPEMKVEPSEDGSEEQVKPPVLNVDARADNSVLTLLGNPSNPKQLFSSLQKTVAVPLPSSAPGTQTYIEVQTPLQAAELPNGITAAKVVPFNFMPESKDVRKFGEVFASRSSLPQLEHPSRSTSRQTSNHWIDPFDAITDIKSFPGERNNYCVTPLPSGLWLQYGGVTSSPSYWNRRLKPQLPASYGDGELPQRSPDDPGMWLEDDVVALQGVYSSFAPSFDSSGAVVQFDSKDMLWWCKRGQNRLQTLLSLPYDQDHDSFGSEPQIPIGEIDENALEEVAENFKPEEYSIDTVTADATKNVNAKDLDEVLEEVSELLATLSSYQRVRSLDPTLGAGRSEKAKQGQSDVSFVKPPSDDEKMVYESLKGSLIAIISGLPPYAVAKLDGDQLADLNVSQKILLENPDYYGTMEKDDYTIQRERAAATLSTSAVNRTATPNASRPGSHQNSQTYNQRSYSTNSRIQQTQANNQSTQHLLGGIHSSTSGSYHTQPYTPARPPSASTQRQAFVPPYSQSTSQYSQQYQSPVPNGYNALSNSASSGSTQTLQAHTQRPAQLASYNTNYSTARSTSPQKPPAYSTPLSLPPNTAPSTNAQQRYVPRQQQQRPPYASYPSNQASATSGTSFDNAAAAIAYARNAADQATLNNKMQTATDQNRQNSATPQPSVQQLRNEHGSHDRDLISDRQFNGTPVQS